jgi:hypothetical protein
MSEYIKSLDPDEWEDFCGKMLRYVFTAKNIWEVPDKDKGDLGLEFFTADGTIYQCYYPDLNIDMDTYKKKVQKKIRDDLKKLITKEKEIAALLGGIQIDQWVLLLPEMWSKDLIKYCNTKKKSILDADLSFINNATFTVKIETPRSYPDGALFAQKIHGKIIDIPIEGVSEEAKAIWHEEHSRFAANIKRKSDAMLGENSGSFKDRVVEKYIQIEKFLDHLRLEHPDVHTLVEDSARAQLEKMGDKATLELNFDQNFIKGIIESNAEAFKKLSEYLSDTNKGSLPFGYVSKWLAECYMDFENG